MFTLIAVFCSTAPVCSATFMNRLLNNSSSTGSGRSLPGCDARRRGSTRRSSMWSSSVISAAQPGSTTVVALASRISAGPAMRVAGAQVRAVEHRRIVLGVIGEYAHAVHGVAAAPSRRRGSVASCTVSPAATASTATASTISGRSGVAKPKRARCASVKSATMAA